MFLNFQLFKITVGNRAAVAGQQVQVERMGIAPVYALPSNEAATLFLAPAMLLATWRVADYTDLLRVGTCTHITFNIGIRYLIFGISPECADHISRIEQAEPMPLLVAEHLLTSDCDALSEQPP